MLLIRFIRLFLTKKQSVDPDQTAQTCRLVFSHVMKVVYMDEFLYFWISGYRYIMCRAIREKVKMAVHQSTQNPGRYSLSKSLTQVGC
jgi:hypothetical protein